MKTTTSRRFFNDSFSGFISILFVILFILLALNTNAQILPSGFSQVLVANGISNPTVMTFSPDGRIFVAQQTGELRIIKNGSLLPTPFVTVPVNSTGERGLLGIAFDPQFNSNQYIYLYHTRSNSANNRITRYTANGDVAIAGSDTIILDLDPISATNHNGGTMAFGPDGKLYIGVGENAVPSNAQSLSTYHGKVLRINSNGSIPAGNPYTTGGNQQRRIWAFGLRNPYTLTFQPGTGRLFVNDVGATTWEEIDDATTANRNFGWPNAEGNSSNAAFTNPVYAYGHGSGSGLGCAITGGTFFNPAATNYPPSYIGKYFYVDLCGNWIDVLTLSGTTGTRAAFASGIAGNPLSIVTGPDGNLYFASRSNSAVYKIIYTPQGGSTTTLNPVADAYVRNGTFGNDNYGAAKSLGTKTSNSAGATYQTFLRFNISTIGTTISSAKLRLYGALNNTSASTATVRVFNVTNNTWQENTITFNNRPAAQTTVLASTAVNGTVKQYYEWDLTQHIISLKNQGATFVSLMLTNLTVTTSTRVVYNSKEMTANKPQLVVTTTSARFEDDAIGKTLLIYDIEGKIIESIIINDEFSQTISTENLKDGIYIIYVDNRKMLAQRFIVKK